MQHRMHDHCLPLSYEHRKPPLTSQPQHQCVCVGLVCVCVCLVWLCVCYCVCVIVCVLGCVLGCVCVLVCVCVSSKDTLITIMLASYPCLMPKTRFTLKSTPNTISLPYSTTALFCPTNPCAKKSTFDFLLRISDFYFLFSATPTGFLFSVCPLTKPPRNLSQILSHRFGEANKDNGIFILTKPLLCQKQSMLVKTPPVSVLLASLATVRV